MITQQLVQAYFSNRFHSTCPHLYMSVYYIKIKCFLFDVPGIRKKTKMLATAIKYQLTNR